MSLKIKDFWDPKNARAFFREWKKGGVLKQRDYLMFSLSKLLDLT